MERNDKCFCGSGKKYKKCHLRINEKSKLASVHKAYTAYDKACADKGLCNNCPASCSTCCSDYFFASENEFLLILEWLMNQGEDIMYYKKKADESLELIKKSHPKLIEELEELMPQGGNEAVFSKYFNDLAKINGLPPCIFLNEERKCAIYECRPVVCRTFGSTTRCDVVGNSTVVFKEVEEMMQTSSVVSGVTGAPMVKRPYPIFYWFSTFLKEPHLSTTLIKVSKSKDISESDFHDFMMKRR